MGGLPEGIYDLWEATGKRPECRYTWDMTRNDNLAWQAKFKPRYDSFHTSASRNEPYSRPHWPFFRKDLTEIESGCSGQFSLNIS